MEDYVLMIFLVWVFFPNINQPHKNIFKNSIIPVIRLLSFFDLITHKPIIICNVIINMMSDVILYAINIKHKHEYQSL